MDSINRAIEDPTFEHKGRQPDARQFALARDLLRLPGSFSVPMLADLFSHEYQLGFDASMKAMKKQIKFGEDTEAKTDDQLAALREASVTASAQWVGDGIDKFTCDDCVHRRSCEYVFDHYNINGDCLAVK
jgi:hypothetical protein